jgi:hypothetical protein
MSGAIQSWKIVAIIGPELINGAVPKFGESFTRISQMASNADAVQVYRLHCNFADTGEESDAQNRHGSCNRRDDVRLGGHRADGVRGAEHQ